MIKHGVLSVHNHLISVKEWHYIINWVRIILCFSTIPEELHSFTLHLPAICLDYQGVICYRLTQRTRATYWSQRDENITLLMIVIAVGVRDGFKISLRIIWQTELNPWRLFTPNTCNMNETHRLGEKTKNTVLIMTKLNGNIYICMNMQHGMQNKPMFHRFLKWWA